MNLFCLKLAGDPEDKAGRNAQLSPAQSNGEPRETLHLCVGGGNWRLCHLLVPLLLLVQPTGCVPRDMCPATPTLYILLLDRLLQQLPQPSHLHHLQQRLPQSLQKDSLQEHQRHILLKLLRWIASSDNKYPAIQNMD